MPNSGVQAAKSEVRRALRKFRDKVVPSNNLMMRSNYLAHLPDCGSYSIPVFGRKHGAPESRVPPSDLWVGYGTNPEEYLQSGQDDVVQMRAILERAGSPIENTERILELGCAAGRMIRCLDELAQTREIFGVDIWATAIHWCLENLSPPFHFATTTISPHLPFEDRYFDLIYCGSIFTHIDDLTDAWFLELRRLLKPGGKLYFTMNDRDAIAVFEGNRTEREAEAFYKRVGGQAVWEGFVDGVLRTDPLYQEFREGRADMITIGRSALSNVMWDSEVLARRRGAFFHEISRTAKAYGHQTGILYERV